VFSFVPFLRAPLGNISHENLELVLSEFTVPWRDTVCAVLTPDHDALLLAIIADEGVLDDIVDPLVGVPLSQQFARVRIAVALRHHKDRN